MTGTPGDAGSELSPLRLLGWTALVVSVVLQLFGLYAPSAPGPQGVPGFDKVGHLAAFAVPTVLALLLGVRWLVPVLVVHAVVSEPLQHWLQPHRQLSALDLVADLAGIVLGVLVVRWVARRRLRQL